MLGFIGFGAVNGLLAATTLLLAGHSITAALVAYTFIGSSFILSYLYTEYSSEE